MSTHHEIFQELSEYAEEAQTKPELVCRKATGNPRLYDRLRRRFERIETDIAALRTFMADNPPTDASLQKATGSVGSCPSKDVGTARADCKGNAA